MFKGKHNIFFMVNSNNGKRLTKVEKSTLVSKSGNPINLNIITGECDFEKSFSYPHKFTVMIANTGNGKEAEGEFDFALWATDPNIKIEALPFPKDFPKK